MGKNFVSSCAINDQGEKKEHEFDFEFEGFPGHGGHVLKSVGEAKSYCASGEMRNFD